MSLKQPAALEFDGFTFRPQDNKEISPKSMIFFLKLAYDGRHGDTAAIELLNGYEVVLNASEGQYWPLS